MKAIYFSIFLLVITAFVACKKTTEPDGVVLPLGATEFSEEEVAFVSYVGGERIYKKAPGFTQELTLTFKERLATKEVFAWDQTYVAFGDDPFLQIELRLRYLQTENTSQKTLAIYMPYWDNSSKIRSNLFELPITSEGIDAGFFNSLVTFHSVLEINGTDWTNVYEVNPLKTTPAAIDGDENFTKIYYNQVFGIIKIDLKNGDEWVLHP